MWQKVYKDIDKPLKKEPVESGKGIIGCEMHELNGWGLTYHLCPKPPQNWYSSNGKNKQELESGNLG